MASFVRRAASEPMLAGILPIRQPDNSLTNLRHCDDIGIDRNDYACSRTPRFPPMKHPHNPILVLAFFALLPIAGNAQQPSAWETPTAAPTHALLTEVIKLSRQTLRFKPTRDDLSIGSVTFSLLNPSGKDGHWLEGVRVNGARPKTPFLNLKPIGKNEFELPELKIEFSTAALGGPLFLSIKTWFNELTNQQDVPYYQNQLSDRYALLTYCTDENDDPSQENARWGANRVKTLADFKARLTQPLIVALNQKPLPEGGVRWPMMNYAFNVLLSDADVATILQHLRERGERYLISVTVRTEYEVSVIVGDRDYFDPARTYRFIRANGAWRITTVEKVESGF
jgi:hypothetical protein